MIVIGAATDFAVGDDVAFEGDDNVGAVAGLIVGGDDILGVVGVDGFFVAEVVFEVDRGDDTFDTDVVLFVVGASAGFIVGGEDNFGVVGVNDFFVTGTVFGVDTVDDELFNVNVGGDFISGGADTLVVAAAAAGTVLVAVVIGASVCPLVGNAEVCLIVGGGDIVGSERVLALAIVTVANGFVVDCDDAFNVRGVDVPDVLLGVFDTTTGIESQSNVHVISFACESTVPWCSVSSFGSFFASSVSLSSVSGIWEIGIAPKGSTSVSSAFAFSSSSRAWKCCVSCPSWFNRALLMRSLSESLSSV